MSVQSSVRRRKRKALFGGKQAPPFGRKDKLTAGDTTDAGKPPLGSGQRFAALKSELSSKPGVNNPGALAAAIGRRKFGKKRFGRLSARGRRH